MNQILVNNNIEEFSNYSEYFKKKQISLPTELKVFNEDNDTDSIIVRTFLCKIKEYVGPFLDNSLEEERTQKADTILLNIIEDLFYQTFPKIEDEKEPSNTNLSSNKRAWMNNTLYFSYLTLFYYTYITNTSSIFKTLMEMAHYNTSKILQLHTNLRLLSRKVIDDFGIDDYFLFMDMFLDDTYIKTLYNPNSFQYLKPVYDKNPEAFKNVSMFVALQKEEIIEVFGLDTLSFMSQEELNFLTKQTDTKQLVYLKQLYDIGLSIDKIKKAAYYPQPVKIAYSKYLDIHKKLVK